jgi:hypothetical protein
MSLVIVWRNPVPPARAERKVRRVIEDRFGTVYLATEPDATHKSFELYPGRETKSTELYRDVAEGSSASDSSTTWEKNGDDTACGCAAVKESDTAEGLRCLSSRRKVNPS